MNLNQQDFYYNPFSGVFDEDISKIIVPRFDIEVLKKEITSEIPSIIEFVGRQGRGKTTHLIYLQQQIENSVLFQLDQNSRFEDVLASKAKLIFIDSIHHFNLIQRIQLFRLPKTIVYTTHLSRILLAPIARKKMLRFRFNGITNEILDQILHNRITISAKKNISANTSFNSSFLISKFGDNYRGIINHLFEQYGHDGSL